MTAAQASRGHIMALLVVLLDVLSVGLTIPVMPDLISQVQPNADWHVWSFGLLQLGFALMQLFCAPLWGAASDRFGRKPVLLIGMGATALSFAIMARSHTFLTLLLARLLCGATSANVSIANACMADVSTPESLPVRYGQLSAMFGLGFVLGPALGGLISTWGAQAVLCSSATLAMTNLLLCWTLLPETRTGGKDLATLSVNPLKILLNLPDAPVVRRLLWTLGGLSLVQAAMETFWLLYTVHRFNWSPFVNGLSLATLGCVAGLTQVLLMPYLQRKWSLLKLIQSGLLSFAACLIAWGITPYDWAMFVLMPLNLLGFIIYPCAQALMAQHLPRSRQGAGMGSLTAINGAAAVLGPLVITPLTASALHHDAGQAHWACGLPFILCSGIILATWQGTRTMSHEPFPHQ